METVSIRNLRGESLRERAASGKPLAITNRGALIGVVIPVAPSWLEHIIAYNLSHVEQSVAEAEQAMADKPMITLHEVVEQLRADLNPTPRTETGQATAPAERSSLTVRIGDLTAKLIEKAGASGQTLALTHDRELVAIVIPVTRDLVEFLLEQNMSRLQYVLSLAAKETRTAGALTPLEQLADDLEVPDEKAS